MPAIPGLPTTVLVAPDSFKGTFSASEVAAAVGAGLERASLERARLEQARLTSPALHVDLCPVADGGEGTRQALTEALGGEVIRARASDPLGRPIEAEFTLSDTVAMIDSAAASGLGLVAEGERDAMAATTAGTGELIVAAVKAGARSVYLGVGGSATTDGGAGAISAIEHAGGLGGASLVILCDVRTPFEDAARVFAPQKGADASAVRRLTARLNALGRRLDPDPRGVPMTGAAGGLSGGLWSTFEAELVPGAAFVLDAIGFDARMRPARAVVTGEGKLDRQSLAGKAVSEVATRARQSGVPCHAIVGTRQLDSFGARMLDLDTVHEASTLDELQAAGEHLAASL